jgi:PBSX family phage portal protein
MIVDRFGKPLQNTPIVHSSTVGRNSNNFDEFKLGDPEPCLTNNYADYIGVFAGSDGIYEPPVSIAGLAKLLRVNAQHGPILYFKRNMILKWFLASGILTRQELAKFAFDYLYSGNAYFQRIENVFGKVIGLKHLPSINMRKTNKPNVFVQLTSNGDKTWFNEGEVIHIKEYDPYQGIYGVPQYFGGIQSALLNEDATLFRRKYYKNGAHMGFIFAMNDPMMSTDSENALKKSIRESKGVGNFRSLFLNFKHLSGNNGSKQNIEDVLKIIPIGDISTKDEFERVKNITLNDMLSMHRAMEALSGQASGEKKAGFGDLDKITKAYYNNEVVPMQHEIMQINEYLPSAQHIKFKEPDYSDLNPSTDD